MSVATTVSTVTKTDVKIKPRIKTALMAELQAYAALRAQLKGIEAEMDQKKAKIGRFREEIGVTSLDLEGFKITQVTSLRSTLDKAKLIEMGVTTEMLEEATVTKPGKPYERVTCPGDKSHGSSDD